MFNLLNREMRLVHVQYESLETRKHCKNARLKVAINFPVIFFAAVQGRQPVVSMPYRFKYKSVIKLAFILFTVYAIGALFVTVFTRMPLDHPDQENGLPDVVMETSKRNRFLGE